MLVGVAAPKHRGFRRSGAVAVHAQHMLVQLVVRCRCATPAGTLLGGITFRNVLVRYDRANKQVGFGPGVCAATAPRGQLLPAVLLRQLRRW